MIVLWQQRLKICGFIFRGGFVVMETCKILDTGRRVTSDMGVLHPANSGKVSFVIILYGKGTFWNFLFFFSL